MLVRYFDILLFFSFVFFFLFCFFGKNTKKPAFAADSGMM